MPSTIVGNISGGALLWTSGELYSGGPQFLGGLQVKLAAAAPGLVYCALPNLSGTVPRVTSGGSVMSGGIGSGLADGMEMSPGDSYFIPKCRLVSGVSTPSFVMPAASSGGRVFWEVM